MPDVGIIGLGPHWETRYRPVLQKMRNRVRVRAIHDPVFSRAETAAAELECDASQGVLTLLRRPDIRAVLILDYNWQVPLALRYACDLGKPLYLGGKISQQISALQQIHHAVTDRGIEVMPEFPRRYAPSTARLKELLVTRLGKVKQLLITTSKAPAELAHEALIGLADWCQYLIGGTPEIVRRRQRSAQEIMEIQFRPSKTESSPVSARIQLELCDQTSAPGVDGECHYQAEIQCEHGSAWIKSPQDLSWKNGTDAQNERLTSERQDVEVMLDHFCRRVVGGLIPVPSLEDACRAVKWLEIPAEQDPAG
ncbi:MAG: hypothetical protein U0903_11960 [Planctomycetales bacterium]